MNQRLLSLDVFRGATVALMMLVNNPGDWGHIYWPLAHAPWHGCTPTDLVFPFFLFIVGVSVSFALSTQRNETEQSLKKIFIRSLKLFGLGLFLNFYPSFNVETVRVMGVLQRIAIVYGVCGVLFLKLSDRQLITTTILLLLAHYGLLKFMPVPGFGPGNLQPETNLGAYLDRLILGEAHLWKAVKTWDPEGLLGTLSAIATGLTGVLTGTLLQQKKQTIESRLLRLAIYGSGILVLAWLWESLGYPINKQLWTGSYTLWTSGLAMLCLSGLYWLIDVQGYKRFSTPFVAFGVNAITVFFLSGLIPRILNQIKINDMSSRTWLYETLIVPFFSDPYKASLAGAMIFIGIWWGILHLMYKHRVIIKV